MKTRSAMDGTARQPAAGDGVLVTAAVAGNAPARPRGTRGRGRREPIRAYDEWRIPGAVHVGRLPAT